MDHVLTANQVKAMLLEVCDAIVSSEEILGQADRDIGDGDHGIGMSLGFSSAKEVLADQDFTDAYQVFSTLGRTMISVMGGASGIIFGLLFYGGSKGKEAQGQLTTEDVYKLFRDSMREIQSKGGAGVGDKTMIDALDPMVASMQSSADKNASFKEFFAAASAAAEQGKEKSKEYIAKFGKAKALGERAIGFPDAGALSVSIIAQAMSAWAKKEL